MVEAAEDVGPVHLGGLVQLRRDGLQRPQEQQRRERHQAPDERHPQEVERPKAVGEPELVLADDSELVEQPVERPELRVEQPAERNRHHHLRERPGDHHQHPHRRPPREALVEHQREQQPQPGRADDGEEGEVHGVEQRNREERVADGCDVVLETDEGPLLHGRIDVDLEQADPERVDQRVGQQRQRHQQGGQQQQVREGRLGQLAPACRRPPGRHGRLGRRQAEPQSLVAHRARRAGAGQAPAPRAPRCSNATANPRRAPLRMASAWSARSRRPPSTPRPAAARR